MTSGLENSPVQLHCEATDLLWPWSDSTPVLMVHGFARSTSVWTKWIPWLAQEHRVYRADDIVALKEIVYEMRFDPVSARYADFGPFFTGLVLPAIDACARVGLRSS